MKAIWAQKVVWQVKKHVCGKFAQKFLFFVSSRLQNGATVLK